MSTRISEFLKTTYFHKLWTHNRKIFWGVSIFSFLTLFFNLIGDEVSPFFVWGMFSEEFPKIETREVVTFKIDGETFDYHKKLTNVNRNMLASPVYYYNRMVENGNEDPTRTFFRQKLGDRYSTIEPILNQVTNGDSIYPEFQQWVKRYLQKSSGEEITSMDVSISTYQLSTSNTWDLVEEEILFSL